MLRTAHYRRWISPQFSSYVPDGEQNAFGFTEQIPQSDLVLDRNSLALFRSPCRRNAKMITGWVLSRGASGTRLCRFELRRVVQRACRKPASDRASAARRDRQTALYLSGGWLTCETAAHFPIRGTKYRPVSRHSQH